MVILNLLILILAPILGLALFIGGLYYIAVALCSIPYIGIFLGAAVWIVGLLIFMGIIEALMN